MTIPAIIKVFAVFGLILVLNRLRLILGLSLLIGAIVLGLWMEMPLIELGSDILKSLTQSQTITLAMIVGLIMMMSLLMEKSGHMSRLVKSFSRLSKDGRTVGAFMAALIGLLPMPAGALFSAPMVDASIPKGLITKEQKTALNYWFRHIWEYWWPLYPGVILVVALLEVETWQYMVTMAPMTIISVLIGTLFILRPMARIENNKQGGFSWSGLKVFIREMMPIIIIILFILVLTIISKILESVGVDIKARSSLTVFPGLVISIIYVCRANNIPFRRLGPTALSKEVWKIIFLVASVMVFKGVMQDSHAVDLIRNELMAYGIPVILVVLLLPFISGFILGIAVGYVGASFPLIIPMIQTPDIVEYLSLAGLAYVFGYIGMIFSPVHLCLLVTKDYYKSGLLKSYSLFTKPALLVLIIASALFVVVKLI